MKDQTPDANIIREHRQLWSARPELRAVYRDWFGILLGAMTGTSPIVEIGSGPGFLREFFPEVVTTDVIPNPWIDVVCDATRLPFGAGTVGGVVLVDVLHHLPRPIDFIREAKRVLRPNGTLAMIEPWVSPLSYFLWRFGHHEECRLGIDVEEPFGGHKKRAFVGNSAIPFRIVKSYGSLGVSLPLLAAEPFLGLQYLATRGFRPKRPVSNWVVRAGKALDSVSRPLNPLAATRVLLVFRNVSHG